MQNMMKFRRSRTQKPHHTLHEYRQGRIGGRVLSNVRVSHSTTPGSSSVSLRTWIVKLPAHLNSSETCSSVLVVLVDSLLSRLRDANVGPKITSIKECSTNEV